MWPLKQAKQTLCCPRESVPLTKYLANHLKQVAAVYIIPFDKLKLGFQRIIIVLLDTVGLFLIFPQSQAINNHHNKKLTIFSAPLQRNLFFTLCLMPYVGSQAVDGFSCQLPKATISPISNPRSIRFEKDDILL